MAARAEAPITRTSQLAAIVERAVVAAALAAEPAPEAESKKDTFLHPATRTFQALRIFANDEMVQVRAGERSFFFFGLL